MKSQNCNWPKDGMKTIKRGTTLVPEHNHMALWLLQLTCWTWDALTSWLWLRSSPIRRSEKNFNYVWIRMETHQSISCKLLVLTVVAYIPLSISWLYSERRRMGCCHFAENKRAHCGRARLAECRLNYAEYVYIFPKLVCVCIVIAPLLVHVVKRHNRKLLVWRARASPSDPPHIWM